MGRYLRVFILSVFARSNVLLNALDPNFINLFNAIVGKVGRVALESVIIQLISSKCLLLLLYATEACPFLARDQSSVSFAVTRVLMKIFRTRSREVTTEPRWYHCRKYFVFGGHQIICGGHQIAM